MVGTSGGPAWGRGVSSQVPRLLGWLGRGRQSMACGGCSSQGFFWDARLGLRTETIHPGKQVAMKVASLSDLCSLRLPPWGCELEMARILPRAVTGMLRRPICVKSFTTKQSLSAGKLMRQPGSESRQGLAVSGTEKAAPRGWGKCPRQKSPI